MSKLDSKFLVFQNIHSTANNLPVTLKHARSHQEASHTARILVPSGTLLHIIHASECNSSKIADAGYRYSPKSTHNSPKFEKERHSRRHLLQITRQPIHFFYSHRCHLPIVAKGGAIITTSSVYPLIILTRFVPSALLHL